MHEYIIHFIFGTIFGSFVSMASFRLLEGSNFLERSRCPKCKSKLRVRDLIPIISYALILKGRCGKCNKKIDPIYLLNEIMLGLLFALMFYFYGYDIIITIIMDALIVCIAILVITDFKKYMIYDSVQAMIMAVGILYAFFTYKTLIEVLLLPLILATMGLMLQYGGKFILKKESMGTGDVKFIAIAGLFLNVETVALFFFLSGILGVFTSIIWKIYTKSKIFPFGPSLASAMFLCILNQSGHLTFLDLLKI